MRSAEAGSPLIVEKRTNSWGATSTYGFAMNLIVSANCGFSGSLETTVTDFVCGPLKFFVSIAATIFPVWPGLIVLSNEATVQPQDGRASEITRSWVPVFLTANTASIRSPFATVPTSFVMGSIEIFGVATVAGLVSAVFFAGATAANDGAIERATRASVSPPLRMNWRMILFYLLTRHAGSNKTVNVAPRCFYFKFSCKIP